LEPRIYLASDLLGVGSQWDAAWDHETLLDAPMANIGGVVAGAEAIAAEPVQWLEEYQYPWDGQAIAQPFDSLMEFGSVEFDYLGHPNTDILLEEFIVSDGFVSLPPSELTAEWGGTHGHGEFTPTVASWLAPEWNQFGGVITIDDSLATALDAVLLPESVDGLIPGAEDFGADFGDDPIQWLNEYQYPSHGVVIPVSSDSATELSGVTSVNSGLVAADISLEEIVELISFASVPPSEAIAGWDGVHGDGEFGPTAAQWSMSDWNDFGGAEVVDGSLGLALGVPERVEIVEFGLPNDSDRLNSSSTPLTGVFDNDAVEVEEPGIISVSPPAPIESVTTFSDNDTPTELPSRTLAVEHAVTGSDSGSLVVALIGGLAAEGPSSVAVTETLGLYHGFAQPISSLAVATTETDALRGDRSLVGEHFQQQLDGDGLVFVNYVALADRQDNLPLGVQSNRQRGHGVDILQSDVAAMVMPNPDREPVQLSVVFGQPLTRLADHRLSLTGRRTIPSIESPDGTVESWFTGLWAMLPRPHDISPVSLTVGTVATTGLIGLVMYEWKLRKSRDGEPLGFTSPASNLDETLLAVELL